MILTSALQNGAIGGRKHLGFFTSPTQFVYKWAWMALCWRVRAFLIQIGGLLKWRRSMVYWSHFFVLVSKIFFSKIFQIITIWNILAIFVAGMSKVIHVHLICPIVGEKQRDWYFASISAVYSVLTPEQVGASKSYLLHAGLSDNGTVITKRAIIKQSTLIRGSRTGWMINDKITPL